MDLLTVSISIGLGVALFLSELFGMAGAGLVVPGYLALHLTNPVLVAATIVAGLAAYVFVRALGSIMIIFGRRRTVLMILAGYLAGMGARYLVDVTGLAANHGTGELTVIGFIIPGLIAVWIDRRGIIESLSSLVIASVIVRLILILAFGQRLLP